MGLKNVLIVGGSAAGWFAAEGLRREGYSGKICIVGSEAPYDRPPLSKQLLSGAWPKERVSLMPAGRMASVDADFIMDDGVALDPAARTLRTRRGETINYEAVVIATGVRPRTLPGVNCAGVHVLRSIEDSLRLRQAMLEEHRLVIVGAGFIGLEVAASLTQMGVEVTVVEPTTEPLASRIGKTAAGRLLELHRTHGVRIKAGISVSSVLSDDNAAQGTRLRGVLLSDGTILETRNLLVSIGCIPNVEWLEGSGIDISDGVVCNAFCAAAPDVWACGDVARWHHAGFGESIRIEHRTNASEQANAVARNILGAGLPYLPVPFFWTDQFDVKLQLAGRISKADAVNVEHGDPDSNSFLLGFRSGDRLVGLLGWNAAKILGERRQELSCTPGMAA